MKVIVFDVGNGSSGLAVCSNGYSMMIDCGGSDDRISPIDQIAASKELLGMHPVAGHDLTLLHITHPDDDHVNHTDRIMDVMPPLLLHRRQYEDFTDGLHVHESYRTKLDMQYRSPQRDVVTWGFDENKTFRIPMNVIKLTPALAAKEKNNSSILRYISHDGVSILFGGDMETPGWDWLAANDLDFQQTMRRGLNILIAPHHGHNSGFPQSLFNLTGSVQVTIHSKATESIKLIDHSDVSNRYINNTTGIKYTPESDGIIRTGKILTTRSNGNILIRTTPGHFTVDTNTPAARHRVVQ